MTVTGDTDLQATRDAIAESAVRVVAAAGMAGLTHAAVDADASLTPGITAGLYETPADLVGVVVDRLIALDGALWTASGDLTPDSPAQFAERMARWVELALTTQAVACRARIHLFLAAGARAAVGHHAILEVAAVVLDVLKVPEPARRARLVVDLVSGAVMHHISVRADEPFDADAFAGGVRRILAAR